jgi:hypothetical protein
LKAIGIWPRFERREDKKGKQQKIRALLPFLEVFFDYRRLFLLSRVLPIPATLRRPSPRKIIVMGPGVVESPITMPRHRIAMAINSRIKDFNTFNMVTPLIFFPFTVILND